MDKKAQIELLNLVTRRLSKMDLKDRHLVLITLLAWHIKAAPEDMKEKVLTAMSGQVFDLLKEARKRGSNETSNLRH